MPIERAAILYLRNSTTVDTGTGIDVRLLDDVNTATIDATQTVIATHTQDSVERTYDPATGGATNTNNAGTTLFKMGWALRLAEDMTPTDDTNCNAYLPAGTLNVNINVTVTAAGATTPPATGTVAATWRASFWRYNLSTDTGTLIAAGSVTTPTWDVTPITGDLGTFKQVVISINVSSGVEFSAGEVLMLQLGLNTGTLPDALLGTQTYTFTLRVDTNNTNITWASGQGIRQTCAFTNSLTGNGISNRGILSSALSRIAIGKGTSEGIKAATISKTFDVIGKGIASRILAIAEDFDLIGKGISSGTKLVNAAKSFSVNGQGEISKSLSLSLSKTATGNGTLTFLKNTIASKNFDLTGKSAITEIHPVQAFRTFFLTGKGEITGRIEIPIDEIPTEGGSGTVQAEHSHIF